VGGDVVVPGLWRVPWDRSEECRRCKGRKALITIHFVRALNEWERTDDGRTHCVYSDTYCVATDACKARVGKRRKRTAVRSSMLVLEDPKAPGAPNGTCRWCGVAITGDDGQPDRRRNYHHGPESWKYGGRPRAHEPDCWVAWSRSRTWDPRIAIRRLADGEVRCKDCGCVCESKEIGADGRHRHTPWDADHEIPLEDGGEHTLANLVPRCVECHGKKTARENRERAARRRAQAVADAGQGSFLQEDAA